MLMVHGIRMSGPRSMAGKAREQEEQEQEQEQPVTVTVETEMRAVMEAAGTALHSNGFGFSDVCFVRLWIDDMSLFPRVNKIYSGFFLRDSRRQSSSSSEGATCSRRPGRGCPPCRG